MRILGPVAGVSTQRMPSGSPRHISVTRAHSKRTSEPTGFLKSNEASLVSVDRNSSKGSSCGKSGSVPWGSHGDWTGRHRTGTSEPTFGEDQFLWPGADYTQVTNELIGEDLGIIIRLVLVQ